MQNSSFLFCSVPLAARSSRLFPGSQLPGSSGRRSLPPCVGLLPSCPLSVLSGWKLHGSEWQLCMWRRWARVQVVGRRLAPLGRSGTQRPNAFAERSMKEKAAQGGVNRRAPCREKGLRQPALGPWKGGRACGGEVPKALLPPHLRLSAFSINRCRRGTWSNDVSDPQAQSCSTRTAELTYSEHGLRLSNCYLNSRLTFVLKELKNYSQNHFSQWPWLRCHGVYCKYLR